MLTRSCFFHLIQARSNARQSRFDDVVHRLGVANFRDGIDRLAPQRGCCFFAAYESRDVLFDPTGALPMLLSSSIAAATAALDASLYAQR